MKFTMVREKPVVPPVTGCVIELTKEEAAYLYKYWGALIGGERSVEGYRLLYSILENLKSVVYAC